MPFSMACQSHIMAVQSHRLADEIGPPLFASVESCSGHEMFPGRLRLMFKNSFVCTVGKKSLFHSTNK